LREHFCILNDNHRGDHLCWCKIDSTPGYQYSLPPVECAMVICHG